MLGIYIAIVSMTILCPASIVALDNGLARLPPMGWMSSERFRCNVDCYNYPQDCINENLIKSTGDAMQYSFQRAGYEYLVIGDCWMATERDAAGCLQADPSRFPNGMKTIADYLHQRNMKLGLVLDAGNITCNGYPGSLGHYQTDAKTLASWGVDFVKLTACGLDEAHSLNSAFPEMGKQLNQTGRPILFLCEWANVLQAKGMKVDLKLVSDTCNQYRSYKDITDGWESFHNLLHYFGDNGHQFINYSKPGSWNDPDQLLVGDFGLSENQQRLQMAVWSIMNAPLFVSADMRTLSTTARNLLLNEEVIKINQDPLGIPGLQVTVSGQVRIWRKPILPKGSFALAFLYENISGGPSKVSVKVQDLGLIDAAVYNITEVLSGQNWGLYKPWYTFNCEVNPTGVLLFSAKALPD